MKGLYAVNHRDLACVVSHHLSAVDCGVYCLPPRIEDRSHLFTKSPRTHRSLRYATWRMAGSGCSEKAIMKNLIQRFRNWQIRKGIYVELGFEGYYLTHGPLFVNNPFGPKPNVSIGPFTFTGPTPQQIAAAIA